MKFYLTPKLMTVYSNTLAEQLTRTSQCLFNFKAIQHEEIRTDRNPCTESANYVYQFCLQKEIISKVGCRPHWIMYNQTQFKTCTNASQLDEFIRLLDEVKAMPDVKAIFLYYKCMKPCKYMEYKVWNYIGLYMFHKNNYWISQIVEEPQYYTYKAINETWIWVSFYSSSVRVKKQIWSYSLSSFVAEYGGLLGLFVGFNFLIP